MSKPNVTIVCEQLERCIKEMTGCYEHDLHAPAMRAAANRVIGFAQDLEISARDLPKVIDDLRKLEGATRNEHPLISSFANYVARCREKELEAYAKTWRYWFRRLLGV